MHAVALQVIADLNDLHCSYIMLRWIAASYPLQRNAGSSSSRMQSRPYLRWLHPAGGNLAPGLGLRCSILPAAPRPALQCLVPLLGCFGELDLLGLLGDCRIVCSIHARSTMQNQTHLSGLVRSAMEGV